MNSMRYFKLFYVKETDLHYILLFCVIYFTDVYFSALVHV
jgi:hypothetical protein